MTYGLEFGGVAWVSRGSNRNNLFRVTIHGSMKRFSIIVAAALVGSVAAMTGAQAQAEKLVTNPPLSQVILLDPQKDGVRLKFPLLINGNTILGPDVILRFIYDDPNVGVRTHGGGGGAGPRGGGDGGHRHGGGGGDGGGDDAGSAYSRGVDDPSGGPGLLDGLVDPNRSAKTEVTKEMWMSVQPFREALDQAADLGTTVVYGVPGKPKPLSTTIDLPDGMLLGEVSGHVRVLALTAESEAGSAGLQPGDEIRSLNGGVALASLRDFQVTYPAIQQVSRKSGNPYTMEVWRASESQMVSIQVGAPPRIPGLFGQ